MFVRVKSSAQQPFRFFSVVIIALTIACSQKPPAQQTTATRPFTPPAQPYKFDPEDGQWTMPAKNYASTRFSGLSGINTGNVRNLRVAWTFSTGATRGHEAAPLVVNNTM